MKRELLLYAKEGVMDDNRQSIGADSKDKLLMGLQYAESDFFFCVIERSNESPRCGGGADPTDFTREGN